MATAFTADDVLRLVTGDEEFDIAEDFNIGSDDDLEFDNYDQ